MKRWGSGGIGPCILNLRIRQRWVVGFMNWSLYPQERAPGTHWMGGWVGLRGSLDAVAKRKNPCSCQESNPGHPAHSLVTILTELSQPLQHCSES